MLTRISQVDIRSRTWGCPFCMQRNQLPPHYRDISQEQIPPELHPANTTIEYRLARPAPAAPIFLFLVDTCQDQENLNALKDSLIMSLSLLPPYALVGLITFGTMVSLLQHVGFEHLSHTIRHKFTNSATQNAQNRTSSEAPRTIRRSKCKRCLVSPIPACDPTCNSRSKVVLSSQ